MLRTMRRYNLLCDIADKLLADHQPCKGCTGCGGYERKPFDCCTGCPFNGPQGCTTRCLACKLWLCQSLPKRAGNGLREKLRRLQSLTIKLNMHYARSTPMEALLMSDKRDLWFFYYQGRNAHGYTR